MYQFEDINALHIEFTSRCNAMCPQCSRVQDGKITPDLPITDMPIELVEKIASEMEGKMDYVHICGNYGDIIAYKDGLPAIDMLQKYGAKFIKIYTNGSARNVSWWSSLAEKLEDGTKGHVVFSIDGLEDTNNLYRIGTKWNKIMENAQAFIDAGGVAVWEWLPFEHNDHQIDEAIQLANYMGFASIILKKNPRFSPLMCGDHHTLKPSNILIHEGIKKAEEGLQRTLLPIKCKYKARKMLYVSFEGLLLPCCWHGNIYKGKHKSDMYEIITKYGIDEFDINKNTIPEILQNHWYTEAMEYTIKMLPTCRKHCTMGSKMSNKDNRIVHNFFEYSDPEPWE